MKKIAMILIVMALCSCSLAKVDAEQNSDLQVIAQAHNALAARLEKVIAGVDKAFGTNIASRQEIFRAALATPTPTPEAPK